MALRDKPDLLYRILFTSAFRVLRKNGPTIVTIVADAFDPKACSTRAANARAQT